MTNLLKTLAELAKVQSAQFASLTYRSKGTGELARHTLLLGVNTEKVYKRDLAILLTLSPRLDGVKRLACDELIKSMKESLEKGIGNNSAYTCKDVYEHTGIKGVKIHKEKGELHLMGYSVAKKTLEKGVYKEVNSSAKTLAKNELKELCRISKIRQFSLSIDALQDVRINGKEIEFI